MGSLKKFYLEVTRLHSLLLRRPLTPFFDMKTATTSSDTKASGYEDRRTFAQVVVADIVDYLYFFMPLVIIHNVGWLLKPLLTDYTQQPAFLMKYKMQQGKNTPPNTAKVIKVFMQVNFNLLMGIPASVLAYSQYAKSSNPDLRYLPGGLETFVTLFVCMICHDFIFYHGHKALHHKRIYKYI